MIADSQAGISLCVAGSRKVIINGSPYQIRAGMLYIVSPESSTLSGNIVIRFHSEKLTEKENGERKRISRWQREKLPNTFAIRNKSVSLSIKQSIQHQ